MTHKQIDYSSASKVPFMILAIFAMTTFMAIIVGGLVMGITIVSTGIYNNTVTWGPFYNGFWGALAGGLAGFIGTLIACVMYALHARMKCANIAISVNRIQ
jgi:hypothetical protein